MALEWKTLPFQALQKAVFLVSFSMLLYQGYLIFAEYEKHEYMQIQEEANISGVTLPMIVVCPAKAFDLNSSYSLFMGISGAQFVGWGRDNMTTEEYLEHHLVEKLLGIEAFISERLQLDFTTNRLEVKKLRIAYYDGQCYSIVMPKNVTDGMNKLRAYIRLNETLQTKISLYDPNTYNGYFKLVPPLPVSSDRHAERERSSRSGRRLPEPLLRH